MANKRYTPGNKSRAESFVRDTDIQAASADVTKTLKMFESDIESIKSKYAQSRKQAELALLKEQAEAVKNIYIDAALSAKKIQIQTEEEVAKLRAAGVKVSAATEAALQKKNERQQQISDKKEILNQFESISKKNQNAQKVELAQLNAQIANANPDATFGEKMQASLNLFNTQLKASLSETFSAGAWGASLSKALGNSLKQAVEVLTNQINTVIQKYGDYTSAINTRLQGTEKTFKSVETLLTDSLGVQYYFKMEDALEDLQELVGLGISYNVEQRAFLGTISEKVANTFDVANASLLRIVRLQQSDSSAARLGMEAYLTRYLNSMFENTEYLNDVFDSVQSALVEASSTKTNENAMAFEYQVQKWLGALYSVGFSDSTTSSLAQALGYLGSGNISALNSSSMQNLLVIAASRAGLSYAELLAGGLDDTTTNKLMASLVSYLQEIGSSDSNVVRSQFAETFGVTFSDLSAALNLTTDAINSLTSSFKDYRSDIQELYTQLESIDERTSMAERVNNLFANAQFSIARNIAQSPVLNAMWSITDMIRSYTGGINIPGFGAWVMGSGTQLDLNATVEGLMQLGIMGIGTLGAIGQIVSGIENNIDPTGMLSKFGISYTPTYTKRGTGLASFKSGLSKSLSTTISNASGSDYGLAAQQSAEDSANKKIENQKSQEAENAQNAEENSATYKLLDSNSGFKGVFSRLETVIGILAASNGLEVRSTGSTVYSPSSFTSILEGGAETVVSIASPTGDTYKTTAEQLSNIGESISAIAETLLAIKADVASIKQARTVPTLSDLSYNPGF